ncbi:MAG: DUF2271 domain-containing protein [Candidatus Cloacimonadaceae bacterium]|nr:DUF2271 domain-containing protein [Candidatus Cloacimonadaceae bacterium]
MKRILFPVLILIAVCLLIGDLINPEGSILIGDEGRNTEGTLAFSVRTVTYNGAYAPRNSGAIWITNAQNQFVKTIKVWADTYRWTLIRWIASSNQNTTGAVTSASYNSHQLHNITWNGKNHQNLEMPDGEYKINVEFTEHNATAANMGKYKQVPFMKGINPIDITIPNETYFRDMTLGWNPIITNGSIFGTVMDTQGNPFAGATVSAGSIHATTNTAGIYSISLAPGIYNVSCSINGYQAYTSAALEVFSGQDIQHNIILNPVSNSDDLNPASGIGMKTAYPNPFLASTKFGYYADKNCRLEVFNIRGQRVIGKDLPATKQGWSETVWDGKADNGTRCPSGIYTIVLRQGNHRQSQRVMLNN